MIKENSMKTATQLVELFNITGNTLIVLLELEEKIDTAQQISRLYTEYKATASSLLPTSLPTNKSGNLLVLTTAYTCLKSIQQV